MRSRTGRHAPGNRDTHRRKSDRRGESYSGNNDARGCCYTDNSGDLGSEHQFNQWFGRDP